MSAASSPLPTSSDVIIDGRNFGKADENRLARVCENPHNEGDDIRNSIPPDDNSMLLMGG